MRTRNNQNKIKMLIQVAEKQFYKEVYYRPDIIGQLNFIKRVQSIKEMVFHYLTISYNAHSNRKYTQTIQLHPLQKYHYRILSHFKY